MNLLSLTAVAFQAGKPEESWKAALEQTAPGHYEGEAKAPAGSARVTVWDADGRVVWRSPLDFGPSAEFSRIGADWTSLRRLAELTGGRLASARDVADLTRQFSRERNSPLWPVLLGAAALLMLVEWLVTRVLRRPA
jgi:hypothetical protein